MDAYKARSAARFLGLAVLILGALVLAWMQKTLVALKTQGQGPKLTRLAELRVASDDPAEAARAWLGPTARIDSSEDIDGDGAGELVVTASIRDARSERPWIERLAVLSPHAERRYRVLFDTGRPEDVPQNLASPGYWLAQSLTPRDIRLARVNQQGEPTGRKLSATWDPASGRYLRRIESPVRP